MRKIEDFEDLVKTNEIANAIYNLTEKEKFSKDT